MNKCRGLWRGKRVNSGEWVYGDLICSECSEKSYGYSISGRRYTDFCVDVDPETLGECTGLTDKRADLAFEGDIIKNNFDDGIGVIRYGEYKQPFNDDKFTKHIGFYVDWLKENNKATLRADLGYWLSLVKIIGNIHDTPELLREGTADELYGKENKL